MPTPKLTNEIIAAAILGFEEQKRHIDTKIAELRALLPGDSTGTAATPEAPTGKRKKFSAASRRKMAMAQRARWAKIKGDSEPPAPATPELPKPKRKLSKAGRAAIVAALKKRWRDKKAAAVKASPAVTKKAVKKAAAKRTAPAAAQMAVATTQ